MPMTTTENEDQEEINENHHTNNRTYIIILKMSIVFIYVHRYLSILQDEIYDENNDQDQKKKYHEWRIKKLIYQYDSNI